MGEEELKKMAAPTKQRHRTLKDNYKEKSLEESIIEAKKKLELNQNLESILSRLEAANAEDDEVNELDPSIFNYYKGRQRDDQQEEEDYSIDDDLPSRKRQANYNPQQF